MDNDPVNDPKHCNNGKMETVKWIERGLTDNEYRGYLKGNVYKYLSRYMFKNGVQDLQKAGVYLKLLEEFERMVEDCEKYNAMYR